MILKKMFYHTIPNSLLFLLWCVGVGVQCLKPTTTSSARILVPYSQTSSQTDSKEGLCDHYRCPAKGGVCQRMCGQVTYSGASTSSLCHCLVRPHCEQLPMASRLEAEQEKSLCLFTSCKVHLTLAWVQRKGFSCQNAFQNAFQLLAFLLCDVVF